MGMEMKKCTSKVGIEVAYADGLYIPEADLWLDPPRARERAFVSHAHADHFARHKRIVCSDMTAGLLRRRFRVVEGALDPMAWEMEREEGGFRMKVLPAGHITGSAMLHLTRISDGVTLLYTGDTKEHGGRTCEPALWIQADTLIMETTFARPEYVFPPMEEVEARVLDFVRGTFAEGRTPVLLGYSLGKAQEALGLMVEHGIPACLHPAVYGMTSACRELGVNLPECPVAESSGVPDGHVVIAPPQAVRSRLLESLSHKRVAMLSGWGLKPGAHYRYRVDVVIPWSDHADHPGLWKCVRAVNPKHVLTVHGAARPFAAELRRHGIDAWCAMGADQLELTGLWNEE
jgi:DNA ligase 1